MYLRSVETFDFLHSSATGFENTISHLDARLNKICRHFLLRMICNFYIVYLLFMKYVWYAIHTFLSNDEWHEMINKIYVTKITLVNLIIFLMYFLWSCAWWNIVGKINRFNLICHRSYIKKRGANWVLPIRSRCLIKKKKNTTIHFIFNIIMSQWKGNIICIQLYI